MKNATTSAKANLDKKFVAHLTAVLKAQGAKADAQYLCSAPKSISDKKD